MSEAHLIDINPADHVSSSGFNRSKITLASDFFVPYIPEFIFRHLLSLPMDSMRAVSKFVNVTQKIIDKKTQEGNATGFEKDEHNMLNMMGMLEVQTLEL